MLININFYILYCSIATNHFNRHLSLLSFLARSDLWLGHTPYVCSDMLVVQSDNTSSLQEDIHNCFPCWQFISFLISHRFNFTPLAVKFMCWPSIFKIQSGMKEITPLLLQFGETIQIAVDIEISHKAPGHILLCALKIGDNLFKEPGVHWICC